VLRRSGNDLWTEFPYSPEYLKAIGEGAQKKVGETSARGSVKSSVKSSVKIIRRLRQNPKMTVTALSQHLVISRNAVHNNIKILNETGWIQRISPAKGGHWEVLK